MKDAEDCARYLAALKNDKGRVRFQAAVDHFLIRHKDELATGSLRGILADAYFMAAPHDVQGHKHILTWATQ